jgi:hypothetical protein
MKEKARRKYRQAHNRLAKKYQQHSHGNGEKAALAAMAWRHHLAAASAVNHGAENVISGSVIEIIWHMAKKQMKAGSESGIENQRGNGWRKGGGEIFAAAVSAEAPGGIGGRKHQHGGASRKRSKKWRKTMKSIKSMAYRWANGISSSKIAQNNKA